jgi:hypothetical protein
MNWEAIGAISETIGAAGVITTLLYLSLPVRARSAAAPGATDPSPAGHVAVFRWKGIQFNSIQSASKPLKKIWLGSLRSTIQQCTDVNCSMTDAGKISG